MTAIVHKHYQPRSVADEFFAQAYPGYRLVAYQANSTSERLSLKLEPINYPICPKCGQQCPKIHATLHREVRCAPQHGFTEVVLELPMRRVRCHQCGSRAMEDIAWLCPKSRLTNKFIAQVQLRARAGATNAAIAREFSLSWDTVKRLDKIQLEHVFSEPDFHGVKHLIMDEFSLQKGHRYATVVMDADTHRVIRICKGKSGNDVKAFFELLHEKNVAHNIQSVAMDMNACFPSLVRQYLPTATVLYDGFHMLQMFTREVLVEAKKHCLALVAKNYADEKSEMKRRNKILASSQWVLVQRGELLEPEQRQKLEQLKRDNELLALLYPVADMIRNLWSCKRKDEAARQLRDLQQLCLTIGREHVFEPARKFARTLKRRAEGIINVGRFGYSSCPLEGANNKIKVIKRNAYGYRDFDYFKLKIFAALPGKRQTPFKGLTPGQVVLKNGVFRCCFHTNP